MSEDPYAEYEARQAEVARLVELEELSWDSFFLALEPYQHHSSPALRRDVYAHLRARAWDHHGGRRRELVQVLMRAARDDPERAVRDQLITWLLGFGAEDFTTACEHILDELSHDDPDVLRLIGVMGAKGLRFELRQLTDGPVQWAALLAQARLGDEGAAARAVFMVEQEPDLVVRSGLLRDLAYTRQPVALDHVRGYLERDDRLPPIKDTVPGTPAAVLAAQALADVLEGFPVEEPTPGDLPRVREWVKAQSEWRLR
jgi:hypothetical protein